MDTQELQKSLSELSKGLLYSSESDYPFELLNWGKKDKVALQALRNSLPVPVETQDADEFFTRYIQRLEMSGDAIMKQDAIKFKKLQELILSQATTATVWRSGKIEIGIYLVITAKDGQVLVLKTTAIET